MERIPVWFDRIEPIVTDITTAAYLQGLMADRKRRTLSLGIHSKVITALQRRLGLSPEMIRGIAATNKREAISVLNKSSYLVERRLQKTILDLTKKGAHVREGVGQLHRTFDKLGITPRNSFQLETIFRTQTQTAYSAGRWQSLQDPDIQEILWGYKLVTVGDDRVRDAHEPMDGTTLPKNDSYWEVNWTPNGWACRCQIIAIYEERDHVRPPGEVEVEGKLVRPGADKGFQYNPGKLFSEMEGVQIKPMVRKPTVKKTTVPKGETGIPSEVAVQKEIDNLEELGIGYESAEVKTVSMDSLWTGEELEIRTPKFTKAYKEGVDMPPMAVVDDGAGGYEVVEGAHRLLSAEAAGMKRVHVLVMEGTEFSSAAVRPFPKMPKPTVKPKPKPKPVTVDTLATVESRVKERGFADVVDLGGLKISEAQAVERGLEKGLRAGPTQFRLKAIRRSETAAETTGFGYREGVMTIGDDGLKSARGHVPGKMEKVLEGTGAKRNYVAQVARDAEEYLELGITHEAGHHVETALLLDVQKAVRSVGGVTEAELINLSGYASTHPVEMFAELHGAMVSRPDIVSIKLKKLYWAILDTADPKPIARYLRR
jgi:SPP1 gp7 family putative phage head morphogenesis protein